MWRTLVLIGCVFECAALIAAMSVDNDQVPKARYASAIEISDVLNHLDALQSIATDTNGNRAVNTTGFNRTLDYITGYLAENTNFIVTKQFFSRGNFKLLRNPTLVSVTNGVVKTHTYSTNLAVADFYHVQYSTSVSLSNNIPLVAIPNLACSEADWNAAQPSVANRVAIVKRGDCTFEEKARLATQFKVAALLIYNDGRASGGTQPISINLGASNRVPALFLSYNLGETLVAAVNDPSRTVNVGLTIATAPLDSVGNICADTRTGDPTQTILIGSHSDSVTAGPGINDNGSGSAGNLALAAALSRLMQTEELGLLGSSFHVSEAKKSTVVGERITDYLVNINLDMIGSPNFIFGIYDGKTAPTSTPAAAKPGSNKMSTLFQDWFTKNSLPWDNTKFDGRSDYGPFLAAGVAAGGLFSGADGAKTVEQRNRYESMLGPGLGGTSGIRLDVCYHKACDKTTNINKFALEKMVQASAYAIENLGQQSDLKAWLYPTREIQQLEKQSLPLKYEYNPINEYFGMPYN
ncbi:unnamed protein product [Adineta ricciae]|uniref:Peptide hydrolase n=1 Tax=Adineta ricciae TaxID=249248 RepID=A0A814FUL0_ADIRI|nr:unnamed protein product [Adineta ricciae]